MPRIFISYRRSETAGHAGRLYDSLERAFGPNSVFMDVDTLEPGVDFIDALENALNACDVVVALIGRRWADLRDKAGSPRLQQQDDFVRLELERALKRSIRVIPVLVQGAEIPPSDALPRSIAKLTRLQALELSDTRWKHDVDRLIHAIRSALEGGGRRGNSRPLLGTGGESGGGRTQPTTASFTLSRIKHWCQHPFRIDDAAISLTYAGRALVIIETMHFVTLPFRQLETLRGLIPTFAAPLRSLLAAESWVLTFLLLGVLMTYIGKQTMRRSIGATVTGLLLSSLTLGWIVAVWTGLQEFTMAGLLASHEIRAMVFMMLFIAMAAITFLYVCATLAILRSLRLTVPTHTGRRSGQVT